MPNDYFISTPPHTSNTVKSILSYQTTFPPPSPKPSYINLDQANEQVNNFNLNIITCNCRSFTKHCTPLKDLIEALDFPEILALCELWSPNLDSLNLPGYHTPNISLRHSKKEAAFVFM